jgi:nucleotide-binding universal stress UspA family protein
MNSSSPEPPRIESVTERILVGYSSDQAGRDALRLSERLAPLLGSPITVVFPYHPLRTRASAEDAERSVRDEVSVIATGARALKHARYRWMSSSWPVHALTELAEYEGAEMIVIGCAHGCRDGRLHMGTVERLVHGAPCAVAVAPPGYCEEEPGERLRIGVGFADTSEGFAALRLACELARRSRGDVLVIAGAGLEPTLATYALSAAALPGLEDEIVVESERALKRALNNLGEQHVHLATDITRGDPSHVLATHSEGLDLLVLGSRAYGPLGRALLGSVSARVVRESRCPVLVLPRGTELPLCGAPAQERPADREPASARSRQRLPA